MSINTSHVVWFLEGRSAGRNEPWVRIGPEGSLWAAIKLWAWHEFMQGRFNEFHINWR